MNEKIFIEGFYSNKVNDNAPAYILGKDCIDIDKAINQLNELRKYAVDGKIYTTTFLAKDGEKRYRVLDTYYYEKKRKELGEVPQEMVDTGTSYNDDDGTEKNIPF